MEALLIKNIFQYAGMHDNNCNSHRKFLILLAGLHENVLYTYFVMAFGRVYRH